MQLFKKAFKGSQKDFDSLYPDLKNEQIDKAYNPQHSTPLIDAIEPNMKNHKGKVNWWWIIWNIGKVVAMYFAKSDAIHTMRNNP